MGSGLRVGLGIVLCVLSVIAQTAIGADGPAPGGDHTVAEQPSNPAAQTAAAGGSKLDIKITPMSEWDPNMQLMPFNSRDGVRAFLAYMDAQIQKTKEDPKIKAEDQEKIVKVFEEAKRAALITFRSVNDYSAVSSAFFVCPVGLELPLTKVLGIFGEKAKAVAPTVSGSPLCIIVALSKNAGTNGTDGFVMGIGNWMGAQATYNWAGKDGTRPTGTAEIQASAGAFVPLNGKAPVLRVGDIQGFYAGVGGELAVPTFDKTKSGYVSGSVSGYLKIDGNPLKSDVAMFMGVIGRTDSVPFPIKGEGLIFTTPWAWDGTEWWANKHSASERQKEVSSKELLQLLEQAKPHLEKYK